MREERESLFASRDEGAIEKLIRVTMVLKGDSTMRLRADARAELTALQEALRVAWREVEGAGMCLAVFCPHGHESRRVHDYNFAAEMRGYLERAYEALEKIGAGEGSRPSSPVAPDGPEQAPSASQGDVSGAARSLATGASGVEGQPVTELAGPLDSDLGAKLDCGCYGIAHGGGLTITAEAFLCPHNHKQNDFSAQVLEEDGRV